MIDPKSVALEDMKRNPHFTYRVVRKGVLTVDVVEVNQDDHVYTGVPTKILRVV